MTDIPELIFSGTQDQCSGEGRGEMTDPSITLNIFICSIIFVHDNSIDRLKNVYAFGTISLNSQKYIFMNFLINEFNVISCIRNRFN